VEADIGAIACLSIDLNNVRTGRGVIEALWHRLSRGAVVLLDDYAWPARVGTMVAALPSPDRGSSSAAHDRRVVRPHLTPALPPFSRRLGPIGLRNGWRRPSRGTARRGRKPGSHSGRQGRSGTAA
jgi:hypothetical protein